MSQPDEEKTHLLTLVMPVRWGDMDALGHVNNTVFFRFYEQVRMQWFDEIGYRTGADASEGPVVVDAYCTFLKPIHHPESLRIGMFGGAPGRSSFTAWYDMRSDGDDSIIYSTGSSKVVWVDYAAEKSKPLPDSIRQLLPGAAA